MDKFGGEHYWGLEKTGYLLTKIISDIQRVGFKVEQTYRVSEQPHYRFFILGK